MAFIDSASFASIWRGYEYYTEGNVKAFEYCSDKEIKGTVQGSENNLYTVVIDPAHPKRSTCNCPHAEGKRIVCKHKVALYFAVFPDEATQYYQEVMKNEMEEEQRQEELLDKVVQYVGKMKKEELRRELITLLCEGPEWQFDRFVRYHIE